MSNPGLRRRRCLRMRPSGARRKSDLADRHPAGNRRLPLAVPDAAILSCELRAFFVRIGLVPDRTGLDRLGDGSSTRTRKPDLADRHSARNRRLPLAVPHAAVLFCNLRAFGARIRLTPYRTSFNANRRGLCRGCAQTRGEQYRPDDDQAAGRFFVSFHSDEAARPSRRCPRRQ